MTAKRTLFAELKDGLDALRMEREGHLILSVIVCAAKETPRMYFAPLVRLWRFIKSLA